MKNQSLLESLIYLVNEQIDIAVKEHFINEALGDPSSAPPPPADAAAAPLSPPEAGGMGDAGGGPSTGSSGGGGAPMDAGMEDDAGMSPEGGAPSGMGDFSNNFGGGGGGGGGAGGEMEGGEGGEGDAPPEEEPSISANPFADAESTEDRLQVILDKAEEIANESADPQKVLKHVKALIQLGFAEPEKAARTISDLFNTENPILQQVSKRLALFTFGV